MEKKEISSTLFEAGNRLGAVLDLIDHKIDDGKDLSFESLCGVFDILKGIKADVSVTHEWLDASDQGKKRMTGKAATEVVTS